MIINLFSVFEPSSRVGVRFNWFSLRFGLILYPLIKWIKMSRSITLIRLMGLNLYNEINPLFSYKGKVLAVIFSTIFFFVLWNNVLGLAPYIFTSTSHLIVTLRITLPLWLGYFRYGWVQNLKWILAHLIPQGTPALLIPFIVVIERVRRLIRPLTLSVRLIANIIAGHLLLRLVSRSAQVLVFRGFLFIIIVQVLLVVLEVAVAIIQAYVLMILRVLYAREV